MTAGRSGRNNCSDGTIYIPLHAPNERDIFERKGNCSPMILFRHQRVFARASTSLASVRSLLLAFYQIGCICLQQLGRVKSKVLFAQLLTGDSIWVMSSASLLQSGTKLSKKNMGRKRGEKNNFVSQFHRLMTRRNLKNGPKFVDIDLDSRARKLSSSSSSSPYSTILAHNRIYSVLKYYFPRWPGWAPRFDFSSFPWSKTSGEIGKTNDDLDFGKEAFSFADTTHDGLDFKCGTAQFWLIAWPQIPRETGQGPSGKWQQTVG